MMAALASPPTAPFSHADWSASNLEVARNSEATRETSEEVRRETLKLIEATEVKTDTSQLESQTELKCRLQDTDLYQKKLVQELHYLNDENDKLVLSRYEINHAIEMLKKPEDIIIHNLKAREFRQGIDLVEDNVQVNLRHENQEIRRVRDIMQQQSDQVEAQIARNEELKRNLKQNICEKTRALDIDGYCADLSTLSTKISPHPNIQIDISSKSSPQSWQQKSEAMMNRSSEARCKSEEMRGKVESLITTSSTELSTAWAQTNRSFDERIAETEAARMEAKHNVEKTNMELEDLDYNIKQLKHAIREKTNPLKLAETRIDERVSRPNMEQCADQANARLASEVEGLHDTLTALKEKLELCTQTRAQLVSARARLQQDIRTKELSLNIDSGKCMTARIEYPHNQRYLPSSAIIANYSLSKPGSYNKCKAKCEARWCCSLAKYIKTNKGQIRQLVDKELYHNSPHCY